MPNELCGDALHVGHDSWLCKVLAVPIGVNGRRETPDEGPDPARIGHIVGHALDDKLCLWPMVSVGACGAWPRRRRFARAWPVGSAKHLRAMVGGDEPSDGARVDRDAARQRVGDPRE